MSLRPYEHLIGGLAGGFTSTAVCHPLDMLRIRFSANEGNPLRPQYKSYADAVRQIVRAEGIRGLYQGLSPSLIGSTLSWGLFFQAYHRLREVWPRGGEEWGAMDSFACSFVSGAIVMSLTNPIWVAKTRLCLQYENTGAKKYSGLVDCVSQMARQEGRAGLYRGFIPGLIGNAQSSLQFAVYNRLKEWRGEALGLGTDGNLDTVDYIAFSSLSKVVATSLMYPYLTLRTRMQDHNVEYRGIRGTIADCLKKEGITGMYKGMLMANIRQLPATVVTFLIYEKTKHWVRSLD